MLSTSPSSSSAAIAAVPSYPAPLPTRSPLSSSPAPSPAHHSRPLGQHQHQQQQHRPRAHDPRLPSASYPPSPRSTSQSQSLASASSLSSASTDTSGSGSGTDRLERSASSSNTSPPMDGCGVFVPSTSASSSFGHAHPHPSKVANHLVYSTTAAPRLNGTDTAPADAVNAARAEDAAAASLPEMAGREGLLHPGVDGATGANVGGGSSLNSSASRSATVSRPREPSGSDSVPVSSNPSRKASTDEEAMDVDWTEQGGGVAPRTASSPAIPGGFVSSPMAATASSSAFSSSLAASSGAAAGDSSKSPRSAAFLSSSVSSSDRYASSSSFAAQASRMDDMVGRVRDGKGASPSHRGRGGAEDEGQTRDVPDGHRGDPGSTRSQSRMRSSSAGHRGHRSQSASSSHHSASHRLRRPRSRSASSSTSSSSSDPSSAVDVVDEKKPRQVSPPHLHLATFPTHDLLRILAMLLQQIASANDALRPQQGSGGAGSGGMEGPSKKSRKESSDGKRKERAAEPSTDGQGRKEDRRGPSTGHSDGGATASGGFPTSVTSATFGEFPSSSSSSSLASLSQTGPPYLQSSSFPSTTAAPAPLTKRPTTAAQTALRAPSSTLCFHARNVPSISIEAYLLRILKYCPTTNEVFLSLLVYFDRMSRRGLGGPHSSGHGSGSGSRRGSNATAGSANTEREAGEGLSKLGGMDSAGGGAGADNKDKASSSSTPKRGFAIDSYNVHRLVIAGVTVASKFFSDVFYTNSRYAKVGGLPLHELNQLELQFLLLNDFSLVIPLEEMQRYADQLLVYASGAGIGVPGLPSSLEHPPASSSSPRSGGEREGEREREHERRREKQTDGRGSEVQNDRDRDMAAAKEGKKSRRREREREGSSEARGGGGGEGRGQQVQRMDEDGESHHHRAQHHHRQQQQQHELQAPGGDVEMDG